MARAHLFENVAPAELELPDDVITELGEVGKA